MKKAFTMLELIFVIIVIGIISVVVTSSTERNMIAQASADLQSKIRYTQHLAMIDDKYNAADPNWYQNRWQIVFDTNNFRYSIQSRANGNVVYARNPMDAQAQYNDINLSTEYDITNMAIVGGSGCAVDGTGNLFIGFDHLGRPLRGNVANYGAPLPANSLLTTACTLRITETSGETSTITIVPETGYVSATFP
jgi:prepilin-type N-terminal cleavage/methylation domain-containing protein